MMLYPAYVHLGDEAHAHSVTLPDFPGCFSAADAWDALPGAIQEAVELYFEGEDMEIPAPTPLETLAVAPEYTGGVWLLVDIVTSRADLGRASRPILGETQRKVPSWLRENSALGQIGTVAG